MRLFSCIFLLLFNFILFSQSPEHYIVGKSELEGLDLYSIIQDDSNSIWFTCNKGLYKYDGLNFTFYKPENAKNDSLFEITKDKNGDIFCVNLNNQIFKVENDRLVLYYEIPKKFQTNYTKLFFDNQNNLVIFGDKARIMIINSQKKVLWSKAFYSFFIETKVNDTLYIVKNKSRYGEDELTSVITNLHDTILKPIYEYKNIERNHFKKIFKHNAQFYGVSIYPTTIHKVENNSLTPINLPKLKSKKTEFFESKEHIWFSDYKNGIYAIEKNKVEEQPKLQKWFEDFFISGVLQDNENNIWLLTFKKGIIVIPNLKATIQKPPKNEKEFRSIQKYNNTIYVSGNSGSIYQYKNQIFNKYFTSKNERAKYFYIKDDYTLLNVSLYQNNQLVSKSGYTRKAVFFKDYLYIGTSGGLHKKNVKRIKERAEDITQTRVYDFYIDKQTETFWIASQSGLSILKDKKEQFITDNKTQIQANAICNIKDQIWVSTRDGIYIFDRSQKLIKKLNTKDGVHQGYTGNIRYEKPFVYWLTSKGIQQYNLSTGNIHNFTQKNGLVSKVYQFEVLNQTVYAINDDKLISYTFNEKIEKTGVYQNLISNVTVNGNKEIQNNTVLNPDENNIEFSYLCSTFRHLKDVRYTYQLIGIDKKPIKSKVNRNFINYANLPAGKYTFQVDSYIEDTHKNQTAYFYFTIKDYWYNSGWFRSIAVMALLLILYSIYRNRINAIIRKRDREKLKKRLAESSLTSLKAQMNPHFLFNAINSIQALVLGRKREEAYEYLTQLSDLIRNNLQLSNLSFATLNQELSLIKQYLELEKLRFEDDFTYELHNNVENLDIKIPSMIIQPFIENAIKHGLLHKDKDRKLSIDFKISNELLTCTIIDNGIGRDASEKINRSRKYESFSTKAIQKRFTILKEYYDLDIGYEYEDLYDGEKAAGTKVIIKILTENF